MTEGLEVLVQEVMAAITTEPWASVKVAPFIVVAEAAVAMWPSPPSFSHRPAAPPFGAGGVFGAPWRLGSDSAKFAFTRASGRRSCGRFGPAREGSTSARS